MLFRSSLRADDRPSGNRQGYTESGRQVTKSVLDRFEESPDVKAKPIRSTALRGDRGFGLVELSVAMLLAVSLMLVFSGTLRGALTGSRENRFRQEATGIALERLELARSLGWEQLAMSEIDVTAPLIDAEQQLLLGDAVDLAADETLRTCVTGTLEPKVDYAFQDTIFTTWTYVTQMTDTLRRIYVLVEWNGESGMRSYRTSTIISTVSAGAATVTTSSAFPDAAIVATGNVALTEGYTVSAPAGSHSADILANGNFSDSNARVDGSVTVGGTADADPAKVHGLIEQNAGTPVSLPDASEVEAWRADLRAQAQAGTILYGFQSWKDTTITAPMWVDGDIEFIGGDTGVVTIEGSGPIYATGWISLSGGVTLNSQGAFLVSDDWIEMSGSAVYRIGDGSSTSGGVVSFSTSDSALRLSGDAVGSVQGIAYAPYGGIELSGSAVWHGALIAGGAGGNGRVTMTGETTVEYPSNLVPSSVVLSGLQPAPEESLCS